MMKIAVLGYGLIGRERVQALCDLRGEGFAIDPIAVYDPYCHPPGGEAGLVWLDSLEAVAGLKPDWVIVAVPHDTAVDLVARVLPWGVKVLMEKPLGRSSAEARWLASAVRNDEQLWVGFNYRFFPGVAQAVSDAREGLFGRLISVTMVLGHGGAPGMETGWKFDAARAGGGCLIDPGIHLLDLCRLLSPSGVEPLHGWQWQGFWNTGIEEEVHVILRAQDFLINLQVSIVRWRSTFRLEIHGTEGYGVVTGRGRSYGPQDYYRGRRWGWENGSSQAESEEHVLTSDCRDSFRNELASLFRQDGLPRPFTACSVHEGMEVMMLYEACLRVIK